ncbi:MULTISPECIES: Rgg/GadR/MutR family transcriptional regulator [unclassified Lactococcus]|uniref:Rgg/GadR/MutR family transcriptional regulator n=1 Tax=unclassified Lactococcus TaxID=2643510 RepID=UPI0011C937E1|nr:MULTISPECIES: Rgg/GadR/MutR family transcriptional regulator [unclassified Lactococcus]MQW23335.1 helix-turn-helix domain-containing protein [Lactococcus sp. dk101]TXK37963.1 helix-turn-helix domain-containing protein [Lactococcus sp. dk310]TXK49617.1 helix-turn-helix domain-containing protein [Lactococcus sp. dk322]
MELQKMAKTFKFLREQRGLSLSDFNVVGISRQNIATFESAKSMIKIDTLESALQFMGIHLDSFLTLVDNKAIFRRYGKVFHDFREQREFLLTDFQNIGLSELGLSLFEEGKIMLNFDVIDAGLQMMHVPLSEYSYALNFGTEENFVVIYHDLNQAYFKADWDKIKSIYEEAKHHKDYQMVAYSAKACLEPLNEFEITEVSTYFFGLEDWTSSELKAFILICKNLETDTIRLIIKDFIRNKILYDYRIGYHNLIIRAALTVSFILINREEYEFARLILKNCQTLFMDRDEYARISFNFVTGYFYFKHEDKEHGLEEMKQAIKLFKQLGDVQTYNRFRSLYQQYVK